MTLPALCITAQSTGNALTDTGFPRPYLACLPLAGFSLIAGRCRSLLPCKFE